MRRNASIVGKILLVMSVAAPATFAFQANTTGSNPLPSVDAVLSRYLQALGGQAALQKLTTRVMKGSIENTGTGETGAIEVDAKAPNRLFILIDIPSNGPAPEGFDGAAGWTVDPDEGPQDITGAELEPLKLQAEFYRDLDFKKLYPKLVVTGQAKVGDRNATVLQGTTAGGLTETMYFDAQTGLMIRDDSPYITDDGTSALESVFQDFQEVDGVKMPATIRQTSPDFDYIIRYKEIRANVPLDDGKFQKPKA